MIKLKARSTSLKVWRYMSFGRFVWMLNQKALWMCRADQLGDVWEGMFSEEELQAMADRSVSQYARDRGEQLAERIANLKDAVQKHRTRFFVNCWTASNRESHAMWSIYCRSQEGVAIQTTLSKLRRSVSELPVLPVKYINFVPGDEDATPLELVVRKRKPFSYEKEWRIVWKPPSQSAQPAGLALPWDAEEWLDRVLIHPGADYAFLQAVNAVVGKMAPTLRGRVTPSGMTALPPS